MGLYSILYGLNCIELYLEFFKMAAMKLIQELSLLEIMYFNPIDDMTSASNLNVFSSFCRHASEISEMKKLDEVTFSQEPDQRMRHFRAEFCGYI